MIEFSGEITEKAIKFLLKRIAILNFWTMTVCTIIAAIIMVILAKIYDLWIILLFLIAFVLGIILATMAPFIEKKKVLKYLIPIKITIDLEKGFVNAYKGEANEYVERPLDKVKIIKDEGEFYYFLFKFPLKLEGFLCQKSLIKGGTIEEFEELFKDKIIKRNK